MCIGEMVDIPVWVNVIWKRECMCENGRPKGTGWQKTTSAWGNFRNLRESVRPVCAVELRGSSQFFAAIKGQRGPN